MAREIDSIPRSHQLVSHWAAVHDSILHAISNLAAGRAPYIYQLWSLPPQDKLPTPGKCFSCRKMYENTRQIGQIAGELGLLQVRPVKMSENLTNNGDA